MANPIVTGLEEALKSLRSGSLTGPGMPPTPEELRKVRGALRLSQEEFAQLIGVSTATLQSWEIGRRRPGKLARKMLERAFD